MTQTTAVVLDPNQGRRDQIRMCLSQCGVLPICFDDEWICLENLFHVKPQFAIVRPTSWKMANHFICIARAIEKALPIIITSDQPELQGMLDRPWMNHLYFLSEPIAKKHLQTFIDSADASPSPFCQPVLIAESPAAQISFSRLQRIGLANEPVLIQGEPGVGKRLIARTIHDCCEANVKLYKPLSARDISGSWIRQLQKQIDRLSPSDSFMICYVIENIESLSVQMQSQLLLIMDMLADKEGNGVGIGASVRFITLSETDLFQLSRKGLFRKDLYYRLSVLNIHVPPLRGRKEDIPLLAEFFTAKYSLEKYSALVQLPGDIKKSLGDYYWPGNVAQLEETIKKAMENGIVSWMDYLNQWCRDNVAQKACRSPEPLIDVEECLRKLMDKKQDMSLKKARQHYIMQVEKDMLKTALFRTHGNCKKAANFLNISYKSMLNKAKVYQLFDRYVDSNQRTRLVRENFFPEL
jgi:DNA-binding NtrC family response regulator